MRSIRNLFVFGLFVLLTGCGTLGFMNRPAANVEIVAAVDGPTHVYWTYDESVKGLSRSQTRLHLKRFETMVRLPEMIVAEPRKRIYIVPVCDRMILWRKGESRQVPRNLIIQVTC